MKHNYRDQEFSSYLVHLLFDRNQLSIETTRPQNDQKYVPAVYTERRFEFRVLIFEKQTKILKLSRACWLRDQQHIKIRQRAWRENVFITC